MTNINVEELKYRLSKGDNVHLVDVREPDERAEFNIGGVHLPLGRIQTMQLEDIEDLKEEEVICYCRSGKRSAQAAFILEQCGFKNVRNLDGGMMAWQAQLS
jgi:rhodanese-related sulfurtransferase